MSKGAPVKVMVKDSLTSDSGACITITLRSTAIYNLLFINDRLFVHVTLEEDDTFTGLLFTSLSSQINFTAV